MNIQNARPECILDIIELLHIRQLLPMHLRHGLLPCHVVLDVVEGVKQCADV